MVLAQLSMLTSLNKSLFGLSFLSAFGSGVSISSLYFLTASEPSVSFLHKFLRPVANAIFYIVSREADDLFLIQVQAEQRE